jgi:hypothetical protein
MNLLTDQKLFGFNCHSLSASFIVFSKIGFPLYKLSNFTDLSNFLTFLTTEFTEQAQSFTEKNFFTFHLIPQGFP